MSGTNEQNNVNNGDENMGNTNVLYPKLDFDLFLGKGKRISSHEALEDVEPVQWSEDVLSGKYRGKAIIGRDKKEK